MTTKPMIYCVFGNPGHSQLSEDLDSLKALADKHPGSEVRGMPLSQYEDPSCLYGWDYPTFRLLSDRIYPEPHP